MSPLQFFRLTVALAFLASPLTAPAAAPTNVGKRLTYLDSDDPFYLHRDFPKLITPLWGGEPGIEAVVILAIDDLRDAKKYEAFLRPILERLKKLAGRAPVSIFANIVTTNDTAQMPDVVQRIPFRDLLTGNTAPPKSPSGDADKPAPCDCAPSEPATDLTRLGEVLYTSSPPEAQRAALAGLQRAGGPRVAEVLLAGWKNHSPAVRAEVLNLLFSREEWTAALLGAMEGGKISTTELGTKQQQQLLTHAQAGIRERAAKLLAAANPERQTVLQNYQAVLDLPGNAARGAQLFGGQCSTCHTFRGSGKGVGPDLATVAGKPVAALLTAILDPNQAVDPAYAYYIGYTKNNRDVSGVIVAETPTSLTLRNAGGVDDTVLRADVQELKSSGLSLMPEGFERAFNPQAIADLIAFIQSAAPKKP